jgi:hypothetical protein
MISYHPRPKKCIEGVDGTVRMPETRVGGELASEGAAPAVEGGVVDGRATFSPLEVEPGEEGRTVYTVTRDAHPLSPL